MSSSSRAFIYVTSLFFAWGFVTAMIDPLIPSMRSIFTLNYSESMLTQFAFFIAYGVTSLPAAMVLARLGAARAIVAALGVMVAGCGVMIVAAQVQIYALVLTALFVIAAGITLLQVAANPLASSLGKPEHTHLRLTLSQAFNSLGTVIAPYLGALLILRGGVFAGGDKAAARVATLGHIQGAFLLIAGLIGALAIFVWAVRGSFDRARIGGVAESPFHALRSWWAVMGAAAIFLYVGAEVSVGSMMINFLTQKGILGVSAEKAGKLLSLYWMGAMVGRFGGSYALAHMKPARLLAGVALGAGGLCLVVSQTQGVVAAGAAIAIGLCNAIMFPTVFTLTLERSSASQAATSGLLCMAIVGGAAVPMVTGHVADLAGLSVAFLVPMVAYLGVGWFAVGGTPASARAAD